MTTLKSKLCIIAIKIDYKYIYDKLEWNGVSSDKHCIYDKLEWSLIREIVEKYMFNLDIALLSCICLILIIIWKEHILRMHLDEPPSILFIF